MRLSERQRAALFDAIEEAALPKETEVYLFGSRVDPDAAGGDIDLLIVGDIGEPYEVATRLRRAYQRRLDERVDVVVLDRMNPDPNTALFVRTLHTERIA